MMSLGKDEVIEEFEDNKRFVRFTLCLYWEIRYRDIGKIQNIQCDQIEARDWTNFEMPNFLLILYIYNF